MSRQDVNNNNKNLYRFSPVHARNISDTTRKKYTD